MKRHRWLTLIALLPPLAPQIARADRVSDTRTDSQPVVVLELFTSQGCSSCPSADRYLLELGEKADAENLVPLAYHVDYWNYIGWEDPYSQPQFTQRQRTYARAWKSGRVYTPQLVINGRTHVVGSNRSGVQQEIAAARKRTPRAWVETEVAGDTVTVTAKTDGKVGRLDVMLAVYETDLATPVKSGENSGRTLKEGYIVRRLTKLGAVESKGRTTHELDLDPTWDRDHLGVVVFLQHPKTREIYTASRTAIPSP